MTWQIIFELVLKIWDVNQSDIARLLGYHRSTISRLINGKKETFSCRIDDIYLKLFDPSNQNSLAYFQKTNKPEYLLKRLKEELHELGLDNEVKQIQTNDYEKFVKGILSLAKNTNPHKPHSSKANATVQHQPQKKLSDTVPHPEELIYEFFQSCEGFGIEDFIKQNPSELRPYQIEDALYFYGRINTKHQQGDSPDKNSTLYQDIISFTDKLYEYIKCLVGNSDGTISFPYSSTPAKNSTSSKKIEILRKSLLSSYDTVTSTIEDYLNKIRIEICKTKT